MRSEVRASPEAEHTVWWLLLCRAVEQRVRAALAAREGEPKRTFDCSWPHCGCDRTGVDSPPCRAEHANERAAAPAAREGEPVYGIFDPDYARVFTKARCIAWSEGYALAVHGSFTRDLDLLAVPWADHACDAEHLVDRIADACGLKPNGHPPGDKPHGRRAWTLLFPEFGDPRFIDLSVFAAPPALPQDADIDVECETCDGRGTIDERLGGYGDSNPAAKCPDCDGAGWWRRRTDPSALHEAVDILRKLLTHGWAEDCQECAIGQSSAWADAKALIARVDAARRDGGE